MGIVIINVGLPKTMSTKLLHDIGNYTDIITIFPHEFTNKDTNNYDFNKLEKDKKYYMKHPLIIMRELDLTKLIKKIEKSGHQVKLILGIRNMLNQIISLCNHWNGQKFAKHLIEQGKEKLSYIVVYNKVMNKFYTNIDNSIKFLNKYDSVIYNLENCNMSYSHFLNELFKLLDIKVNINIKIPDISIKISDYNISHCEEIEYLKKNIDNFDKIEEHFNKVFKNVIIRHIKQF